MTPVDFWAVKIDVGDAGKMKSAPIAFLDAQVDFMAEYG